MGTEGAGLGPQPLRAYFLREEGFMKCSAVGRWRHPAAEGLLRLRRWSGVRKGAAGRGPGGAAGGCLGEAKCPFQEDRSSHLKFSLTSGLLAGGRVWSETWRIPSAWASGCPLTRPWAEEPDGAPARSQRAKSFPGLAQAERTRPRGSSSLRTKRGSALTTVTSPPHPGTLPDPSPPPAPPPRGAAQGLGRRDRVFGARFGGRREMSRGEMMDAVPGAGDRATHVLMAHVLEQAQLAVGALGEQLGLEGPVQLLYGHLGARAAVHRRAAGRTA